MTIMPFLRCVAVASTLSVVAVAAAQADELLGVGIAGSDDHVYYWLSDGGGQVISGTTSNPSQYRTAYAANLLPGRTLVATGIARSNDHVYYWWTEADGSMSVTAGTTSNPTAYRAPYGFNPIGGLTLIASGIAGSDDHVYYWWRNANTGQLLVSSGTTAEPLAYRPLRAFQGGLMQQFNELIGAAIAGSNDHVYYWWRNRQTGEVTVTSGTSTNPLAYRSQPYAANLPLS